MAINSISLTSFRSLKDTTLDFHPQLNLITGDNGAGKTSILEAINLITLGRSQITNSLNEIIQHGKQNSIVFARFHKYRAGIKRERGASEFRVDGQPVEKLSVLANKTPVKSLNTFAYQLAIGRPVEKRNFIDWSLFHVEHSYRELWVAYNMVLKQRNRLLKEKRQLSMLDYWDAELVKHSMKISELRAVYAQSIFTVLKEQHENLIGDLAVEIEYRQGWEKDVDLMSVYRANRDRELKQGYTLYGVQRDTLKITSAGYSANSVLSRGQIKRLSIALHLAQVKLVQEASKKDVIVLIDDLSSELDKSSVNKVLGGLMNSGLQLFLTSINGSDLCFPKDQVCSMFHVEHGIIRPVLNH